MSEISKARSKLSAVGMLLKKKKFLSALISIHEALTIYLKTPLLKHEKKDFINKLEECLYLLKIDKDFIQQYPISLEYKPGHERELWSLLQQAILEFQTSAVDEAKRQMEELERLKHRELEKGRGLLKDKKYKEADEVFKNLIHTFKEDTDLKISISDIYMEEGMVEQALQYLKHAYTDDPSAIHVYNKLGIALRRAGKLELAEKTFKEAISRSPDDEYLLFNLGRVYIDMKEWEKAARVAKQALEINPSFKEAKKMLHYAESRLKR